MDLELRREAQHTDIGGGTCLVSASPLSVVAAENTDAAVAGNTAAAPGSTAVAAGSSVPTAH